MRVCLFVCVCLCVCVWVCVCVCVCVRTVCCDPFAVLPFFPQLQNSGTLALISILHAGFPHRMPIRPAAAKLRLVFEQLLPKKLKEQEKRVHQLYEQLKQAELRGAEPFLLNEDLKRQRRILETLRHWNPLTVRDRTLSKQ